MQKKIYTHDLAADIVEIMEEPLITFGINVPTEDDDERDPDDLVGFYGDVYSELIDATEAEIIWAVKSIKKGAKNIDTNAIAENLMDGVDNMLKRNDISVNKDSGEKGYGQKMKANMTAAIRKHIDKTIAEVKENQSVKVSSYTFSDMY